MSTTEIVVADIGGTHVRFALATVAAGHVALAPEIVLRVAEHASLATAWAAFAALSRQPLPRAATIAAACPVGGEVLQLTNNPWVIHPAALGEAVGVDRLTLINDVAAVAHAVALAEPAAFTPLCGPDAPLAADGVVSVIGVGTGLGVATLVRQAVGYTVIATEGGHTDFAPLDAIDDALLARLRARFRRVSVERVVAGPGLADIHATLARIEGEAVREVDDPALWAAAFAGDDPLATAALDRFCLSLGAVAGDIALTQGAGSVVIAGGLGLRLADRLPQSGFSQRFIAKGRFAALMAAMPVKILTHPQPGLLGAAAAFAQEHP